MRMSDLSALPGLNEVTADLRANPHILKSDPSAPVFDKKGAGEQMVAAVLPVAYERVLTEIPSSDDTLANKKERQEQAAHEAVRARVPDGNEFKIFRHENITAIVIHDSQSSRVTVAFDGGAADAKDMGDILSFSPKPHPLGGQMHGGYADSITRKGEDGTAISARVLAQVNAYAAQHEGQVDVQLTGVSRGGSVATATLADWMQDGKGVQGNVHFKSLTTFGSPAVGDEAFTQAFDAKAKDLKLDYWRVIAGDDAVPRQFTQDAWYKQDLYRQGGNAAYLIPDENGGITQLVNPQKDELDKARAHLNPLTVWHTVDKYAHVLGLPQTAFDVPSKATHLPMKDTDTIELPVTGGAKAPASLER